MELRGRDGLVTLHSGGIDSGLAISDGGIEGWYSTPDPKVELVERQSGDGAHAVPDDAVLYAARVISVGIHAIGGDSGRDATLALMAELGKLAHQNVQARLVDSEGDTFARGFLSVEWDAGARHEEAASGSLTITCADNRRYSSSPRTAYLTPSATDSGGLLYDDGAAYLLSPVQFGGEAPTSNACTVSNSGTSAAYPTITASGSFPRGIRLSGPWGELSYPQAIGSGAPLVLDCLTRTASVLGVDVTRALSKRDFPAVPAGGSCSINLLASGTGTVAVEVRDTYV